jgi:hypothetical protein
MIKMRVGLGGVGHSRWRSCRILAPWFPDTGRISWSRGWPVSRRRIWVDGTPGLSCGCQSRWRSINHLTSRNGLAMYKIYSAGLKDIN